LAVAFSFMFAHANTFQHGQSRIEISSVVKTNSD
jgi:hypothetical protein